MNPAAPCPPRADAMPVERTLLNEFLENVPDSIYFKDLGSRFIALSSSLARKHGLTAAEMLGRTDHDFFAPAHALPAFEDEQRIIRSGEPIIGKLEKETWPDGHITWALTSKMPLRDATGTIVGTFGLSKDVTKAKETEAALEKAQRDLLLATRQAGMAEVATGVLHNVGNVLNSLNIAATVIAGGLADPQVDTLVRAAALLRKHEQAGDLGAFLTSDPKGRLVPGLVESLGSHFRAERERLLREVRELQASVDHIKEIVSMQQAHATVVGVTEPLDPVAMLEDAVRMNSAVLANHGIQLVREFTPVPSILGERGKVLQILVNLLRNAKHACDDAKSGPKIITLGLKPAGTRGVRLLVRDSGVGIPAENLTRIFQHGFTTRATGHGFGLHSSALAAKEMKGSLTAHSDGPGTGATFTLELPTP